MKVQKSSAYFHVVGSCSCGNSFLKLCFNNYFFKQWICERIYFVQNIFRKMTKVGQKKITWSRYFMSQSVIWSFHSKSISTLSPYFGALVIQYLVIVPPLTTHVHWVVKIKWETDWMLSPAPIIIIGESKAVTSFYVPPWRRNFRGANCGSHYLTDMLIRVPLHSSIFLTKFY